MPNMTKYTAEYMLAQVKDKTWLNSVDPNSETLKLYPIPELKTNLSNCCEWERAVRFHLQYYGLHDLVECMKIEYPDNPRCEDFKTPAHWRHWQHHCLHAYSIIQSQAVKVIDEVQLYFNWHIASSCPHDLFKAIRE